MPITTHMMKFGGEKEVKSLKLRVVYSQANDIMKTMIFLEITEIDNEIMKILVPLLSTFYGEFQA